MLFNAAIAIAAGERGQAAIRLRRLALQTPVDSPHHRAALEAGLWLGLSASRTEALEPLLRLEGAQQ